MHRQDLTLPDSARRAKVMYWRIARNEQNGSVVALAAPGPGNPLGTAGTAIYLTVESSLQSQLDAELQALSHGARFSPVHPMSAHRTAAPHQTDSASQRPPVSTIPRVTSTFGAGIGTVTVLSKSKASARESGSSQILD